MLDKSEYLHPDKECLSRQEIEALQLERLKATVKHCYTNEVYKKKFAEAGITPDDIKTLDDVRKLFLIYFICVAMLDRCFQALKLQCLNLLSGETFFVRM